VILRYLYIKSPVERVSFLLPPIAPYIGNKAYTIFLF
jgi:hypothetical protein